MKICIPVSKNNGLNSTPYGHFGSAPFFLIYDLDKDDFTVIDNDDSQHEHGMCQPLKALGGLQVEAVLAGDIGAGALMKLNHLGIKVYRTADGSISENIKLLKKKELTEFTADDSCSQHDCHS